jgi:hypothetical protein
MMYDELVKRLRKLSGTDNLSEFDEAADAIEELAAFKAQITDGHFYCMKDGVLYAAKYERKKAKSIQLPRWGNAPTIIPADPAEEGK